MATILDFRPVAIERTQQTGLVQPATKPGSAELIFFPGVRYERATIDPDLAPRKRKARARVHDQLDLPD